MRSAGPVPAPCRRRCRFGHAGRRRHRRHRTDAGERIAVPARRMCLARRGSGRSRTNARRMDISREMAQSVDGDPGHYSRAGVHGVPADPSWFQRRRWRGRNRCASSITARIPAVARSGDSSQRLPADRRIARRHRAPVDPRSLGDRRERRVTVRYGAKRRPLRTPSRQTLSNVPARAFSAGSSLSSLTRTVAVVATSARNGAMQ